MNIYKLLKQYAHLGGGNTRLFGLWVLHILHRRYIGVFIDPILGCNYRCQMCYFSNEETRRTKHGRLTEEQINNVAKTLFPRTLKLQIGCGAEPSIDMQGTLQLVKLGMQYKVPYISVTSNGVLLTYDKLQELVRAGLDELTISLHGIHRDTYTKLMGPTSNYDAFLDLLQSIKWIKEQYPKFMVRINYTMNADNVDELSDFDTLFHDIPINVLQLRPIRELDGSAYQNFDLTHVSECIETVVRPLAERCREKGTIVLFPEKLNIERFEKKSTTDYKDRMVTNFVYQNINAQNYENHDIHFDTEDYSDYCHRVHVGWQILKALFSHTKEQDTALSNPLNYDIQ